MNAEHGDDAATPHEADRGHGSATTRAVFRDPPPADEAARPLRLEIARALVSAPTLPVDLPAFGLRFLSVEASGRSICLVLGVDDPNVRLRLTPRRPALAALGRAKAAFEIEIGVEPLIDDISALARTLDAITARLKRSTTEARWTEAARAADALKRIPVGIPLGFFRQIVAGVAGAEGLVRTGFLCNQDCGMCWQARDWAGVDADQVSRWIEDLFAAGARRLIVSGGEPTLDPALERHVARARQLGFASVMIETNAIQASKPGFAARLAEAGLTDAFVSLHSGDADVSDAITRAKGTHARTVEGVRRLLDAGVAITLNAVMTQEGLDHLEALPDFIHASFGAHRLLRGLMLSVPADPFEQALSPAIVPDPTLLRAVLPRVIDRALALGIRVTGLDGPCGPQLCAFSADPRVTSLAPISEPLDFRVHLPGCDRCAVRAACFGVRRAQAERHGDACIAPLATAPKRLSNI